MPTPRHGSETGFFDGATTFNQSTAPYGGVAVPAGATSRAQQVGREGDNLVIYVTTSGASTWTVQVAHTGDPTTQGQWPDPDAQTFVWHDLYYLGTGANGGGMLLTFAGAGSFATIIPDFAPGWVRLKRTDAAASVTVTAGWEIQS